MSAVEEAKRVFERLVALTPEPDHTMEAGLLIEESQRMAAERETEIAILKVLLGKEPDLLVGNEECRQMRDLLSLRDRQWNSALIRARKELSHRRQAAQRARQAQRAYRTSSP